MAATLRRYRAPRSASPPTCCPPTAGSAAVRPRSGPRRSPRWPPRPATYLGTSHRQAHGALHGQPAAQRPRRAVRPARRLRGPARQRRHHRVLGRRRRSASSSSAASTSCSASSRPSSPSAAARAPVPRRARRSSRASPARAPARGGRGGRRPLRPHPQRDLDRRGHAARRGPRAPTPGRWSRSTPPRPPAACGSTPAETDVYYFAPQKCLASDGGLWLAACSPAAIERIERIAASDRWIPASLDLGIALDNSRKDQTYNTPALATIFLAVQQIEWINQNGGLGWAAGRCDRSAETIYGWAEASDYATPFVADPGAAQPRGRHHRPRRRASTPPPSPASCGPTASSTPSSYRKLGRNQLRVALFPAIEPDDVAALTSCIDHVVSATPLELRSVRQAPSSGSRSAQRCATHGAAGLLDSTLRRAAARGGGHPDRGRRALHRRGGGRPSRERRAPDDDRGRRPGSARTDRGATGPTWWSSTSCSRASTGIEVCRRMQRDRHVPVLMLTARDDETDLLVGLAVGADDYLTKPFSIRELEARVARHPAAGRPAVATERGRIRLADVVLDRIHPARATRAGDAVHLTPTEFDLLVAPGPTARRGAHPRAAAGRRVGLPGRVGRAHRRLPRPGAAPQARRRRRSGRCTGSDTRWATAMSDLRPLERLRSIKLKLGIVIVAAVLVTLVVNEIGLEPRLQAARPLRSSPRCWRW